MLPVRRAGTAGVVLLVREGRDRLQWQGFGTTWQLRGLWPDAIDAKMVDRHLRAGYLLLVVLDGSDAPVLALPEEVPTVPRGVSVLSDPGDEVLELGVPFLDWLPEEYRLRGERFSSAARLLKQQLPAHVLPPLLLSPEEPGMEQVRFVAPLTWAGALDRNLDEVADALAAVDEFALAVGA
jgi:hypothetical protein